MSKLITAINKHQEITEELINASDLKLTDRHGNTALHCAVLKGDLKVAKQLLEKNISLICMPNEDGKTPIDMAYRQEEDKINRLRVNTDLDPQAWQECVKENKAMSALLTQYERLGTHYDDSSEDDTDDVRAFFKTELDWFGDNEKDVIKTTLVNAKLDLNQVIITLSFIAHELGINLVHNPKFHGEYLSLKKKFLFNTNLPSKEVENVITSVVTQGEIRKTLLKDMRTAVQTVKSGTLNKLLIDCPAVKNVDELQGFLKDKFQRLNIERKTLDKGFSYEIKEEPLAELIAVGRLMTRSLKRDYANIQNNKQGDGVVSILGESPINDFARVIKLPSLLPNTKVMVLEDQRLYEAKGTRVDSVKIKTHNNSTNYLSIANTIENIQGKLGVTDQHIVKLIRSTLTNDITTHILDSVPKWATCSPRDKKEFSEFIGNLTYLLFGTEAVRNPASLIIHQMMLDLIDSNSNLTFSVAFYHNEPNEVKQFSGGVMPMSQLGAVEACRLIHDLFKTSIKYSYDKKPVSNTALTKYMCERIINFEANIMIKWLMWKGVNELNAENCFNTILSEGFKSWFGVIPESSAPKQNKQEGGSSSVGTIKQSIVKQINQFCEHKGIDSLKQSGLNNNMKIVQQEIQKKLTNLKQSNTWLPQLLESFTNSNDFSIDSSHEEILTDYFKYVDTLSCVDTLSLFEGLQL
jgi:hypothetical protein